MESTTVSPPTAFVGLTDAVRVGQALRATRQRRSMSQAETAAEANISREALSRIENGGNAREETLRALLGVLGYEIAFLPVDDSRYELADAATIANRLACYVPALVEYDDRFRLRVVLHDFGLVWQHADATERAVVVADEPPLFDERWDAFLGAYVEHLCYRSGVNVPEWTQQESRFLDQFWWPGDPFEFERGSIILKTPAAFEVHGIWLDERELKVV
ncbi:MAG: helix-turn-helix transcriptional regulator [Acidimicrobiaceae bacterium]|nr:helix-turn-helix transcriptional regulator [Acidimicrobiaceae bacterium]